MGLVGWGLKQWVGLSFFFAGVGMLKFKIFMLNSKDMSMYIYTVYIYIVMTTVFIYTYT